MDDVRVTRANYFKHGIGALFKEFKIIRLRFVGDLTFAINHEIHGESVAGYHFVSIALHGIVGILVYRLIVLLMTAPKFADSKISKHKELIGILAALLFVFHPVQTQVVNYIVQRYTILATLFYVASIFVYIKCRMAFEGEQKNKAYGYLALSGFLALLGIYTKEIVLSWPLMVLAVELFCFSGSFKKRLQWLVLPVIALILGLFLLSKYWGYFSVVKESSLSEPLTRSAYMLTETKVFWKYMQLVILPIRLNLDYYFPLSKSITEPAVMISIAGLIGFLGLLIVLIKKMPMVAFGLIWMLIGLSIESTILPIEDVIFEHRLYLPMVGIVLSLISLWFYLWPKKREELIIGLVMLFSIFAGMNWMRNQVWKDELSLWTDIVGKSPQKARAHLNYGLELQRKRFLDQAVAEYEMVAKLEPKRLAVSKNNIGGIRYLQGRLDEAATLCIDATKLDTKYADAFSNVGVILTAMGKPEEALPYAKAAVDMDTENEVTMQNYKIVLSKLQTNGAK
jgi:tetratricopeptide (TPR) repeat protein